MNTDDYLKRIKYEGRQFPGLEFLRGLQEAHLMCVPFENLDIHYGNRIELNVESFYHKVVLERRGGFCYELNSLFQGLLEKLGYETKLISARVYSTQSNDFGAEYDHLAIIINLEQDEYLVDVGFGEFAFHPLKLEMNTIQSDPRGQFVIEQFEKEYYKVSRIEGETKSIQYIFSTKNRDLMEFAEMCHYHQTSPDSHFTRKKLISIPSEKGRVTITGNLLKVTENGKTVHEYEFAPAEFGRYLHEYFGMDESKLIGKSS